MVGYPQGRRAREDQVDVGAGFLDEALEVREEGGAALVLVDAPHVKHVGPAQAVLLPKVERSAGLGKREAAAHHDVRHAGIAARLFHEGLLFGSEVDDPPGRPQEAVEDREAYRGVLLGRRNENGLVPDQRKPEVAVIVPIAIEEEQVESSSGRCHGLQERGRLGPVGPHPVLLLFARVGSIEDRARDRGEAASHAPAADPEPMHWNSPDLGRACGVRIRPVDVTEGAGCEDLHLMTPREALHEPAAVGLGAPVHLGAITLDDEGQLQGRGASPLAASRASRAATLRSRRVTSMRRARTDCNR